MIFIGVAPFRIFRIQYNTKNAECIGLYKKMRKMNIYNPLALCYNESNADKEEALC